MNGNIRIDVYSITCEIGFFDVNDNSDIIFTGEDEEICKFLEIAFAISRTDNNNIDIEPISSDDSPYRKCYYNPIKLLNDYKDGILTKEDLEKYIGFRKN